MMPLVAQPCNTNSPESLHGKEEQGNVYEHRTSEVGKLNELPAENRRLELRAETLLELEGNNERW
jgi:hypothetical protein